MATITSIQITEGDSEWGQARISADEARERQAIYETAARAALAAAYPGVETVLDVRRGTDMRSAVTVTESRDADGVPTLSSEVELAVRDRVREILGRAWQDACEADVGAS